MDPVSIAIGAAVGAVVGVLIGMTVLGKGKELEATTSRLEQLRRDSGEQIEKLRSSEAALKSDLAAAKTKINQGEEATKKAQAATETVRTKLRETELARDKSTELAKQQQQARQKAEGQAKSAEKLGQDASARVAQLEADTQKLQEELAGSQALVAQKEKLVGQLRAKVGSSASGLKESVEIFADAGGSLDQILGLLCTHEDQTAAVLADSNGIVVAAAGDRDLRDGIAAVAQLLTRLGRQFEGMIPFNIIRGFDLRDCDNLVIAGRATTLSGETIAVATYGPHPPNGRVLDGAIASLSAALS